MRLAKAGANLLAAVAISVCFAPGGSAQQALSASQPRSAKAKTAAPAHTQATAPAPAPAAAPVDEAANASPVSKRDPFAALINNKKDESAGMHLPPGKAGLVIATVRVDGTVRSGAGMIAVVSNPANSVYFIREGDRLYDGDVEKIGLDGVTFRENSKDAFGHPIERTVTKRIYASAGE